MLPSFILKQHQNQGEILKPNNILADTHQEHASNDNNNQKKIIKISNENTIPEQLAATPATTQNDKANQNTPLNLASPQISTKHHKEKNSVIQPQILKHIDNYIIFNEKLGGGQFSQVYKAMNKNDVTHEKYFAAKVLSLSGTQFNKFSNYNQVLQKEIDILLKARHENLICMHDLKQTPNNLYLFLDYCNGGNLRSHLASKKNRLSEEESIEFLKQICAGYKALLEKNIIHRDLKPENILLHDGKIKIGDFGFARIVKDVNEPENMTQKCSPLYAPPQILTNRKYSSKCDVWSVGCIFFEMLFGRPPFTANSVHGLTENILNLVGLGEYPVPSFPPIGQATQDLLVKMLRYYENDRISWEQIFNHSLIANTQQSKMFLNVRVEPINELLNQSIRKNLEAVWENKHQQQDIICTEKEEIKQQNQQIQQTFQDKKQDENKYQDKQLQKYIQTIENKPITVVDQANLNPNEQQQINPVKITTLPSAYHILSPINQFPNNHETEITKNPPPSDNPLVEIPQQQNIPCVNRTVSPELTFAKIISSPKAPSEESKNDKTNKTELLVRPARSSSTAGLSVQAQEYLNPAQFKIQSKHRRHHSTEARGAAQIILNTNTTPLLPFHGFPPRSQQQILSPSEKSKKNDNITENNNINIQKSPKSNNYHPQTNKNLEMQPLPSYSNTPLCKIKPYIPYSKVCRDDIQNYQQGQQKEMNPNASSKNDISQEETAFNPTNPSLNTCSSNYNNKIIQNNEDKLDFNFINKDSESGQNTQQISKTESSTGQQQNLTQNKQLNEQYSQPSVRAQLAEINKNSHFQCNTQTNPISDQQSNLEQTEDLKTNQITMINSGKTISDQKQNQSQQHSRQSSIDQDKDKFCSAKMSSITSLNIFQPSTVPATSPERELSENEKYILYMKQIKQQEEAQISINKIDNYFLFLRKRALFANATLLNFWNSTKLYQLPSYISCFILYCLCSYYLLGLEQLRKILFKESEPIIIKEGAFKIYEKSTAFSTTKNIIQVDTNEAKQLLQSIEPFIISEIRFAKTSEARSLLKYISMKPQSHEEFRVKLFKIFPKILETIDLDTMDRSSAKGIHMIQVFTNIQEFIPSKKYLEFDFNKFYDDKFNNLSADELKYVVRMFNIKYFQSNVVKK